MVNKNKKKFDSRTEVLYDNEAGEFIIKLSLCRMPSGYHGVIGVGQ